jgi:hypothetical protein
VDKLELYRQTTRRGQHLLVEHLLFVRMETFHCLLLVVVRLLPARIQLEVLTEVMVKLPIAVVSLKMAIAVVSTETALVEIQQVELVVGSSLTEETPNAGVEAKHSLTAVSEASLPEAPPVPVDLVVAVELTEKPGVDLVELVDTQGEHPTTALAVIGVGVAVLGLSPLQQTLQLLREPTTTQLSSWGVQSATSGQPHQKQRVRSQ